MKEIIKNALAKLNKNSTLDEIKTVLKEECEKVSFKISSADWNEMFDEIIIVLN
jgi:hypothetical protein